MKTLRIYITSSMFFFSITVVAQNWREHIDKAVAYLKKGKLDSTELVITDTEKYFKETGSKNDTVFAALSNLRANVFRQKEEVDSAEFYFLKGKDIYQKAFGLEDSLTLSALTNLADFYSFYLINDKAIPLAIQVKELWLKIRGQKSLRYADAAKTLAVVYSRAALRNKSHYPKALENYFESKTLTEELLGKQSIEYENLCWNLGFTYKVMGDFRTAATYFAEGFEVVKQLKPLNEARYRNYCVHLGECYRQLQVYDKAESILIEALKSDERRYGIESTYYAYSAGQLANLYTETGQYRKVIPLHNKAKEIYSKDVKRFFPSLSFTYSYIALYYMVTEQYDSAYQYYKQANELLKPIDKVNKAINSSQMAVIATIQKKYATADSILLISMAVLEEGFLTNTLQYLIMQLDRANLKFETDSLATALQIINDMENRMAKLIDVGHNFSDAVYELKGKINWKQGNMLLAKTNFDQLKMNIRNRINYQFPFYGELQRSEFISSFAKTLNLLNQYYVSAAKTDKSITADLYSLRLQTNSLLLRSEQWFSNKIYETADTTQRRRYNEWLQLKQLISRLSTVPADERKWDIKELEQNANDLEKQLSKELSASGYKLIDDIDFRKISAALKENEAAIEFLEVPDNNNGLPIGGAGYYALILKKDFKFPELVYLFDKRQLDALIQKRGVSYKDKVNNLYSISSKDQNLYQLLWQPLEVWIKNVKRIYYTPVSSLHKLSFAAIQNGTGRYITDQLELVQLTTTLNIQNSNGNNLTGQADFVLYGGVEYSADSSALAGSLYSTAKISNTRALPDDLLRNGLTEFQYLPGTNTEVQGIYNLVSKTSPINTFKGNEATEESFKALHGKASPEVLHIATHGFFFPDPVNVNASKTLGSQVFRQSDNALIRSGLAFAGANHVWKGKPISGIEDGILTSYEVSNMYMPKTKLAVLSACETGLGDIHISEGVYGLQRAFKMAGVQNIVMSLWKVPDAETAEFMIAFYTKLLEVKNIDAAFNDAQHQLKNKYRTEPYKWAAWILVK